MQNMVTLKLKIRDHVLNSVIQSLKSFTSDENKKYSIFKK